MYKPTDKQNERIRIIEWQLSELTRAQNTYIEQATQKITDQIEMEREKLREELQRLRGISE